MSGATSVGAVGRLPAGGIRPLIFWVVLVNLLVIVGIAVAGYQYHRYNAGRWTRKNEHALAAVADLKARIVSTWRRERLGDGQMILHNPFLLESLRRCLRSAAPPEVESELRTWMRGLKDSYGYDSILLVRPNGQVAFSLLPGDHVHAVDLPLLQEVRARGQVVLSDLTVTDEKTGEVRLTLGVPIFLLDGRERAMGVLLLRLDPAIFIYPLLLRWPFPSDTAESFLVRQEGEAVVFLTPLRHSSTVPLTRRVSLQESGVAAVTAIHGGVEVFRARDYRGERVLAVARRISDSPWVLMAKIDAEEVERPLEERSWMVAIITAGLIVTSALVTSFLVRRQRREEDRRSAERIVQLNRLYEILSHISRVAAHARSPVHLFEDVCRIPVEHGAFKVAWVGQPDEASGLVVPVASHGIALDTLAALAISFRDDDERGRGPTGLAVREGRAVVVQDVETDPRTAGRLVAARGIGCRSCAAFPLRMGDRVSAVFVAYAGERGYFDAEQSRLLEDMAGELSFSLEKLEAETQRQKAQDEVVQLNRELESRVQERTTQLERANRELEAFSYSVSHDLRSPLRAIDGFSRVVLEDCEDSVDERTRHYLGRISDAVAKMDGLISALLDLSRVGQAELEIRTVDLSTLVREVVDDLRRGQAEREVQFEVEDGVLGSADLQLMHVVLTNLLSNAWKFTLHRVPATIAFGTAQQDGQIAYYVRDDGAGFDQAYQDRLFLPFQRLHSESEFPGHGVGLTTVQRAIHRLGGRVWAESQVGKGCTVWFTLRGA